MLLDKVIRYTRSIGNDYSISARDKGPRRKSHYNRLYHANLLHTISADPEEIRAVLVEMGYSLKRGLLEEHPELIGEKHDDRYVAFHLSALYYQLVEVYLPSHPTISAIGSLSPVELRKVLQGLDHSNAWYVSNIIMAYAVLLAFNERRGLNPGCLDACADYLESIQDPKTGLWMGSSRAYALNGMAAAFHYLPLFKYLGRKIPKADKLFDSVASLALGNGAFCSPNGYACLDYDGICCLLHAYESCPESDLKRKRGMRLKRIASALKKNLLDQIQPDGGFPEAGSGPGLISEIGELVGCSIRHKSLGTAVWNARFAILDRLKPNRLVKSNSVGSCLATLHESNTFATWFRYMTISVCEDILGGFESGVQRLAPARKFPLPGLGYL